MKNIRAIILEKYKDENQFEKMADYIYRMCGTPRHRIALRFELEPNEDSQYPLEDILEKYWLQVADHLREFQYEGKRILEVELESPDGSGGIHSFATEIIGKRVYNKNNGETIDLIIEDDIN